MKTQAEIEGKIREFELDLDELESGMLGEPGEEPELMGFVAGLKWVLDQ